MKNSQAFHRIPKNVIPVRRLIPSLLFAMTASIVVAQSALAAPLSGIDKNNIDSSVRIQDDFYRHVNGAWLKKATIPGDKSRWGSFDELRELSITNLRAIIEGMPTGAATPGSEAAKIVDAYASFTDEVARDARGMKPLEPLFTRIAGVTDKKQLPALMADLAQVGVVIPFAMFVNIDGKDSSKYAVLVNQSGLGLPDRDYYLNDADEKNRTSRAKYVALIEKTLTRAGESGAAVSAKDILALETELARAQWTRVENRNPVKTYNKVEIAQLAALAPGFEWTAYAKAAGYEGKVTYVIVRQPSALTGFAKTVDSTSLSVWKAYLKWHVLNRFAPYLDRESVADNFTFNSTVLRGVPDNEPNWKRGVRFVEGGLGDAVGKLYVQKHFPPENKARMEKIVANLVAAYRQSIDSLEWMSPAT
ncbi:MAG: M13 family metallopeptidase N-terminal domain-containing protein, partial [Betaproteobacteria bacterium]